MKPKVKLMLAAAASTLALAVPSAASANTICVNAPNCPAVAIDAHGDLKAALNEALLDAGPDTVLVGDKGSPYVGPFVYGKLSPLSPVPNAGDSSNTVSIERDGAARPVLTTADGGDTVIDLINGSLFGIDVRQANSGEGIGVSLTRGTISDVALSTIGPGDGGTAVQTSSEAALVDVRITGHGDHGLSVGFPFASSTVVRNVTIADSAVGVDVAPGSSVSLTGSRVDSKSIALNGGPGAALTVGSTLLTTRTAGGEGVIANGSSVALDHVTVAHVGPAASSGNGIRLDSTTQGGRANLSAVALAGYAHEINRSNTLSKLGYVLTAQDSVWNPSGDIALDNGGAPIEKNNVHVDPALADLAGGDLRPRASSKQIDLDTTTAATYRDAAGVATVDGDGDGSALADAGGLEYRRQAPTIDALEPATATLGATAQFTAKVSDPDADAVQVSWQFDDGATADGADVSHAFTTAGNHAVTVTAVDETGLKASKALTVAVTGAGGQAPGAPGAPGAPAGGDQAGGGNGGGGGDHVAPKLTSVSLSSKKTSLGKAKELRLRFKVSEAATIRIVPRRIVGGQVVASSKTIVKRVNAGKASISLAGLLKKAGLLHRGRVSFAITAIDGAGNKSGRKLTKLALH